jgi:deoxycytidine triphosphate deaminase
MGVLADWQIERDIEIIPFSPSQKRKGVVSYGVTSYGYDMRCGYQFRVLKNYPMEVVDPKNFRDEMFDVVDLTPHRCILEQSNSTGRYHRSARGTPSRTTSISPRTGSSWPRPWRRSATPATCWS